jgi:hypothetical protein
MKQIGQILGWVDNLFSYFSNLITSAEKIINFQFTIYMCVCVYGLLKFNANNNY